MYVHHGGNCMRRLALELVKLRSLGSGRAMLGGLHARLCRAFLVFKRV